MKTVVRILFLLSFFGVRGATGLRMTAPRLGNQSYEFVTASLSWKEASRSCIEQGGQLANVGNIDVYTEISTFLTFLGPLPFISYEEKVDYWIDARNHDKCGYNWQTSDGQRVGFTNWAVGEPDNGGEEPFLEQCAYLSWEDMYLWKDARCKIKKSYICEYTEG